MSSQPTNDKPAAKVVMKVPTPDSLVEVRVSPPESNFEVKVAPGEDIIELHIRAGSNSFVEVRISPPGEGRGQSRSSAKNSHISIAGGSGVYRAAHGQDQAAAGETISPSAQALPSDEPETLLESEAEETSSLAIDASARPEALSRNMAGPAEVIAPPPDITSFSEGVFVNLSEEIETITPENLEENTGLPGPDPALFIGQPPFGFKPADSLDNYISPAQDENITEYWEPEEAPPFTPPVSSAAQMALARLSAAVEKEKVEMASNPGVWKNARVEEPDSGFDDEVLTDLGDLNNAADLTMADHDDDKTDESASSASIVPRRSRKLAAADTTVMVQMYEDISTFNAAADTSTPLSEDEEMEIGPLGDEVTLGSIDMDGLESLDKHSSSIKKRAEASPKAKPLSTVMPGNTIIPK